MPSSGRTDRISRRRLLGICGACLGVGGGLGYGYGSGLLRLDSCDPAPLDVSPIEWPAPNYDGANTRTAPTESAPEPDLVKRWDASANYHGSSYPIVNNGSLFLLTDANAPDRLFSYDLFTGDRRWTRDVSVSRAHHPLVSGGDSLFLPGDRIGETTVSRAVATADGSGRWRADAGGDAITAAMEAGRLFVHDDNAIVALDAHDGENCWGTGFDARLRSSAADAGSLVVVNVGTDGRIVALDAETGDSRWERDVSEHFHPDEESINDAVTGHIVIGAERTFVSTYGGRLIALDAASGATEWVALSSQPELTEDGGRTYGPARLEPVGYTGEILLARDRYTTDDPDVLYGLDPATGDETWRYEPNAENVPLPAVAGETAFLPADGDLQLLDAGSGDSIETQPYDGDARSVVLADGICLLVTNESIIAFGEEAG